MNTKSSKAAAIWFEETGETRTYTSMAEPSRKPTPAPSQWTVLNWINSFQTSESDKGSTDLMTIWKYEEESGIDDKFIRS